MTTELQTGPKEQSTGRKGKGGAYAAPKHVPDQWRLEHDP